MSIDEVARSWSRLIGAGPGGAQTWARTSPISLHVCSSLHPHTACTHPTPPTTCSRLFPSASPSLSLHSERLHIPSLATRHFRVHLLPHLAPLCAFTVFPRNLSPGSVSAPSSAIGASFADNPCRAVALACFLTQLPPTHCFAQKHSIARHLAH
jgi:hypothetical protein